MKFRMPGAIAIVMMLAMSVTAFCEEPKDLVEPVGSGSINWSSGVIQAVGMGAPPEWAYGKPQARPMALRAAQLDAYRNLLEVVQGVRIESSTTVKNFMVTDDTIRGQVDGMIRGAQIVKKEYMSDGTVEVTLEMSLKGGFAQLVLPQNVKQIEPIKTSIPEPPPEPETAPTKSNEFTGLVVDARGLNAKPAMSPKILDENNQEVYGAAFVSREYAVQQGMSGYSKNIDTALSNQRVTDKPLTVKGLKTEGGGRSNVVISNADASKVRSASENLSFMKKCRVMIVVD